MNYWRRLILISWMEIVSFDLAQHHLQYLQKVSNILAVPAVLQMNHFYTLDVVHWFSSTSPSAFPQVPSRQSVFWFSLFFRFFFYFFLFCLSYSLPPVFMKINFGARVTGVRDKYFVSLILSPPPYLYEDKLRCTCLAPFYFWTENRISAFIRVTDHPCLWSSLWSKRNASRPQIGEETRIRKYLNIIDLILLFCHNNV